jgi:glutamate synthase (NADPH/NADH) large chain
MVDLDPVEDDDNVTLKELIQNHVNYTGSQTGRSILANWNEEVGRFIKVMPRDYKAVLLKRKLREMEGKKDKKEVENHG